MISEHDGDHSSAFEDFMKIYHIFWYAVNHDKVDSFHNETAELFEDAGIRSINNQPRSEPQIYHEVYTKLKNFKQHVDDYAQKLRSNHLVSINPLNVTEFILIIYVVLYFALEGV